MSLRYAILHHTGVAEPHYDLMFETFSGSDLATWRSPIWPIESPTTCTRIKDHRREYLDLEGELSHGRGRVDRVAGGECAVEIGENARWTIKLLNGASPTTLRLNQMSGDRWIAER